jgi:hypothetical protein
MQPERPRPRSHVNHWLADGRVGARPWRGGRGFLHGRARSEPATQRANVRKRQRLHSPHRRSGLTRPWPPMERDLEHRAVLAEKADCLFDIQQPAPFAVHTMVPPGEQSEQPCQYQKQTDSHVLIIARIARTRAQFTGRRTGAACRKAVKSAPSWRQGLRSASGQTG